ncbi:phosphatidylglycerophosphatase GEP4 [Marchantia polymorpha subsp. ruderalis]|uniref:Uncharacterized protein n=2 Tax=Marchantia polymorpha TaxID=3197 RepID=A0AAF6BGI1_MARPO|nr:hypothetical protein MARPO_0095s0041 [Marchantia polymorpha]BBN11115.1 hypothetical protein Mp_5g09180 [Marchantia polymorpha subsp. ruderalis]|eukprot:PTQ32782.1 hypothetical protein MARPO_0095s0041 [Marchantia polymorpha]
MSTIISKSMVAPVSLLEPSPTQSFMCKSLRSHLVTCSLNPASSSSSSSCFSAPCTALFSPSLCGRALRCSTRTRFATSGSIRRRESSFGVRCQQSEDVSMMNAGGSSPEPPIGAPSSMAGKSLLAKLGQSINVAGIAFSSKVILKERHLAIPHVSVPDISWIDWKALRAKGFEAVLFDKDNTLTAPYGQNVWPSLLESLEECRTAFDGRLALLSNSAGLYQFDPDGAEAKALEDKLGISVIRHGSKKPSGDAQAVADHFGCDPSLVVMVGDRYFTDIVYGNSNGLLTIRPAPLTSIGEPFVVRRVRALEDTLVEWWRTQGTLPTKHRLFDHPVDFIKDPGFW